MAEATRKLRSVAKARATVIKDLNDVHVQEEILSPPGTPLKLGGRTYTLYPLSGRSVRRFMGLTQQVLASAEGQGSPEARIGGVLTEQYLDKLLPYLAEATFEKPSDITVEQLHAVIAEIDTATQSSGGALELVEGFAALCTLNKVMEAFAALPK